MAYLVMDKPSYEEVFRFKLVCILLELKLKVKVLKFESDNAIF